MLRFFLRMQFFRGNMTWCPNHKTIIITINIILVIINIIIIIIIISIIIIKLGFPPCKAEQPLKGIGLQ